MRLHVTHRTRFNYAEPVKDSFNEVRLQPASTDGQRCDDFRLRILPPARVSQYVDLYQNNVHLFEISRLHRDLTVSASSTVHTTDRPSAPALDATVTPLAAMAECARMSLCHDFLQSSTYIDISPDLWRRAVDVTYEIPDAWQAILAILRHLHREFRYEPNATHVNTRADDVLTTGAGVCQDFAHVMIGLCRALKIPARYVSGYLYNGPADQLKGAQASHAWVEVFLPATGWCALDPTNNCLVDGRYVKIGAGRDYADVSPVRGTYRGTPNRRMTVEVLVTSQETTAAHAVIQTAAEDGTP